MGEASQQALEFDTSVPNIARMYDYWLGGKDNFAADREAADRQARAIPQLPWLARQNRDFLQRAVDFRAREGVTQFLDIGSGLPTNENVHEIAQRVTGTPAWCTRTTIRWWWRTPGRCCPVPRPRPSGETSPAPTTSSALPRFAC